MPFYRSTVKSGGSGPADYSSFYITTGDYKFLASVDPLTKRGLPSGYNGASIIIGNNIDYCGSLCRDMGQFNQPVYLGENVTNCDNMFSNTYKFNQPVYISDNVSCLTNMFADSNGFNQVVSFNTDVVRNNVASMFRNCANLNQPVTVPTLGEISYAGLFLYNCTNFNQPVTFPQNIECKDFPSFFSDCKTYNQPVNMSVLQCREASTYGYIDVAAMFRNCTNFNSNVEISGYSLNPQIPVRVRCPNMFNGCVNFNGDVSFLNNYESDITSAFRECSSFNRPLNLMLGNGGFAFYNCISLNSSIIIQETPTAYFSSPIMSSMFAQCTAFNQDVIVPSTVMNVDRLLRNATSFGKNVYFKGTVLRSINANFMFANCNNAKRKNVWFNSALNGRFNLTNAQSIVGASVTWTTMENGFYNAAYNVYCYNNYAG